MGKSMTKKKATVKRKPVKDKSQLVESASDKAIAKKKKRPIKSKAPIQRVQVSTLKEDGKEVSDLKHKTYKFGKVGVPNRKISRKDPNFRKLGFSGYPTIMFQTELQLGEMNPKDEVFFSQEEIDKRKADAEQTLVKNTADLKLSIAEVIKEEFLVEQDAPEGDDSEDSN